jgi:hypothetical protein
MNNEYDFIESNKIPVNQVRVGLLGNDIRYPADGHEKIFKNVTNKLRFYL